MLHQNLFNNEKLYVNTRRISYLFNIKKLQCNKRSATLKAYFKKVKDVVNEVYRKFVNKIVRLILRTNSTLSKYILTPNFAAGCPLKLTHVGVLNKCHSTNSVAWKTTRINFYKLTT